MSDTSFSWMQRYNWSELEMTHERRVLDFIPGTASDTEMPSLTPVVGDLIRYLDNGIEISPMTAFGIVERGGSVEYETYRMPHSLSEHIARGLR